MSHSFSMSWISFDWIFVLGILTTIAFKVFDANPGVDFVLSFPQNDHTGKEGRIYITPALDNVSPVKVEIFTLDRRVDKIVHLRDGEGKQVFLQFETGVQMPAGSFKSNNYTIRVTADNNITVIVKSIGYSNHEIYLALPVTYLGTQYIAVTYEQPRNRTEFPHSFLVVMATYTSASVNITLPPATWDTNPRHDVIDFDGVKYIPGDIIRTSLDPFEAVQIQAPFDLTGSLVNSDSPVAAWSGMNRTRIKKSCWSYLIESLPPVETLGTKYVLIPLPIDAPTQEFRIVARHWFTRIKIFQSGGIINRHILAQPGNYIQFTSTNRTEFAFLRSTKEVLVTVYLSSKSGEMGDAAMGTLMPVGAVDQSSYRFTQHFPDERYSEFLLSILIQKGKESDLLFNGESFDNLTGTVSVDSYDVVHRDDLLVLVANVTESNRVATFDVRHSGGFPFMAYLTRIYDCEAETLPLAYGVWTDAQPTPSPRIPKRCPRVDSQAESTLGVKELLRRDRCCIRQGEECDCSVTLAKQKCFKLNESRLAQEIQTVNAPSLLRCQEACDVFPSCNGVNFNSQSADEGTRCQLLIGQFYGLVPDDGFKFLYCKSKSDFKIGSRCSIDD